MTTNYLLPRTPIPPNLNQIRKIRFTNCSFPEIDPDTSSAYSASSKANEVVKMTINDLTLFTIVLLN